MPKLPFSQRLQQPKPILADGAMGTLLMRRGNLSLKSCFDQLNISDPDLVRGIHADYVTAGAEIIESNTFGANHYKLAEHGLSEHVAELNQAGVRLVRDAVGDREDVYIAGAVGPLGVSLQPYGHVTRDAARAAFAEQIQVLLDANVDVIVMETFANHDELVLAVTVARELSADIPIVAQATFSPDNVNYTGHTPSRVANELSKTGATVIGVNCGTGPAQISQILQSMHTAVPDAQLSALPNAGFPQTVGGRAMYPATADYFGDYALTFKQIGASIIGGCCGTTPEHISAMRQALDDPTREVPELSVVDIENNDQQDMELLPTDLATRLANGEFTITVELTPPRGYHVEKVLTKARALRDAGADILNVADTPAAKMKMSAWAVSHIIQDQIGVETVLHFPTRGRNILRVQGDLLASHALGLRNLFVTMGDPTRIGDYPEAMDGYDIVPSKLIGLIKHSLNNGHDMAGNSIGNPTNFTVGCAVNMASDDPNREVRVLGKKMAGGADFALGQVVFDPPRMERFLERYREVNGKDFDFPVLLGVIPLFSVKHALFLHNEVPGVYIPEHIIQRLADAGDDAPQEGIKIAIELLETVRPHVRGAYVIPYLGRYELAAEVVDAIANPVRA